MTINNRSSIATSRIIPRKVQFNWENSNSLQWIPGDVFASHWANAFHYLLTQGEKFFCRTFREALPLVDDPALRADVEAFIKQEAIHSAAHHSAIEGVLKRLNIEGGKFERQNQFLFDDLLAKKPFGLEVPKPLQHQWLLLRVGVVAVVEHYTAALGAFMINETNWDDDGADPVIADLFRWHCAEEVEHRTVAYDLYRYLGGRWPLRTLLMTLAFPLLMERQGNGIIELMKQDPAFAQRTPRLLSPFFWRGWRRSAKRGNAPGRKWFLLRGLRFISPGYDPEKEASTEMALNYIASSPAVLAAC